MQVCSIEFISAVAILAAFYFYLPSVLWRQALLACLSAVCLYLLMPNWESSAVLGAVLLSGYGTGKLLRKHPSKIILSIYLILLVAAFVYLKKYTFLQWLYPRIVFANMLSTVGLSYILFRQIHFLIEQIQGAEEPLSLWRYLNYQLNIFSLLSGPITRYHEFLEDWDRLEPLFDSGYDLLKAFGRIWIGVIKITIISTWLWDLYQGCNFLWAAQAPKAIPNLYLTLATIFYLYPLYIYFNFSGYCDIVIGGGYLLGLRIPENFNSPFLSRNLIEFWTRWHITLGLWIRDYLYTPMLMSALRRWPRKGVNLAFLFYFVAFFLAGVWHGSTSNFIIYGLLHGFGLSVAKLWEMLITRLWGREGFLRYLQMWPIRLAAILLTIHYFCFTCVIFGLDIDSFNRLAGRVIDAFVK
ncbi:MAG: hypothetical protein NTX50_29815 [Candidatus Sumerlaeota bacterium]|nr:hypothetical protein [Candidatus Sumerlaeota bacterium]